VCIRDGSLDVVTLQWFDDTVTSLQSSLHGRDEAKSAADVRFEEEAAYISNLEAQMLNVCYVYRAATFAEVGMRYCRCANTLPCS
jgi:hypothetical protein